MTDLLKTRILGDIIKSFEFAKNEERTKIKELSDTLEVVRFNREILEAAQKGTDEYFNSLDMPEEVQAVFNTWQSFKSDIREWSKYEAYYTNWDDPV